MMHFPWSQRLDDVSQRIDSRLSRDKELRGLASLTYHSRVTQCIRGATQRWMKDSTVIDFRPLFAVTVYHLQRKLAREIKLVIEDEATDEQLDRIRRTLKSYTNALRDFEFIHATRWETCFVKDIAASRIDSGPGSKLQSALMSELGLNLLGPRHTLYSDEDLLGSFDDSLMQYSSTVGLTRGSERQRMEDSRQRLETLKQAWVRFLFAIGGGLAIVIPILVLGINKVDVKTVIIVCVSIVMFAIAVASWSKAEPESLLAATAAYAAVLSVFVNNTTCSLG